MIPSLFTPFRDRGRTRPPCPPPVPAWHPAGRRAGWSWPRARSSRSGGWRPAPPRCRRGSTRRRGCSRASGGRSGTSPCRRRRAAGRAHRGERCRSGGPRSPSPPRRGSSSCRNPWGIRF